MVLYYDPISRKKSVEWRKSGEAPPRKAKVTQSTKIMATIFWDCRGILLIDFKIRNTTVRVDAAFYASLLLKLRDASKEKRRGMLSR
jgi:hypothetical protein